MNTKTLSAFAVLFSLLAATAYADDDPANFTQRHIVIPEASEYGELMVWWDHFGEDGVRDAVGMDVGASYGLGGVFEAGFAGQRQGMRDTSGFRLQFLPDIAVPSLYLYGRLAFLQTEGLELGAELGVNLKEGIGLQLAIPVRWRLHETFAVDGSLEFVFTFDDPTEFDFVLNIQPRFAPHQYFYVGIDTGIAIRATSDPLTTIPLGFEVGSDFGLFVFYVNMSFTQFLTNSSVVTDPVRIMFGTLFYI